jgi:hypothetical protein
MQASGERANGDLANVFVPGESSNSSVSEVHQLHTTDVLCVFL